MNLLSLLILLPLTVPDTLSLDQAHEMAVTRFPLEDRVALEQDIRTLRLKNADVRWLPQLTLAGLAQYQSDVTRIDLDLPGMPGESGLPVQPKDRYQIALEVEQPLYDGGRTRTIRELENHRSDRAVSQVRVEQHELRERVDAAWFAIHSLRAQQKVLELTSGDLREKISLMQAQVQHGTATSSSLDILKAEQLRLKQQSGMLAARERSALAVLEELLDARLSPESVLLLPEPPEQLPSQPEVGNRPETALFQAYRDEFSAQKSMVTASYRPVVSAFGQAAAGRPGLNLFEDEFQPWYVVGVRARWNIWNWGSAGREREELSVRSRLVDNREEVFTRQVRMAAMEILETMAELEEAVRRDREIIALHESIVRDAAIRLENGAITATEYITELNSRQRAEISRELHRIQLAQAWQSYVTLTGGQQ